MEGILKNEELWLTSYQQLNDPSELHYGTNFAFDELERQAKNGHGVISLMRGDLRKVFEGRLNQVVDFFVSSLSRDGDELGQWRGYGDDGKGYSIGLAPHPFMPAKVPEDQIRHTPIVAKIEYDKKTAEERQRKLVVRAVETVHGCITQGLLTRNEEEKGQQFLKSVSVELAMAVLQNSVTCKHPAYSAEKEVRLVIVRDIRKPPTGVETRVRGSSVVSFLRYKMPIRSPGNISGIVVGPASMPSARRDVEKLLLSLGIDPAGLVSRSDIPYRGR